jgi:hypothetical protein
MILSNTFFLQDCLYIDHFGSYKISFFKSSLIFIHDETQAPENLGPSLVPARANDCLLGKSWRFSKSLGQAWVGVGQPIILEKLEFEVLAQARMPSSRETLGMMKHFQSFAATVNSIFCLLNIKINYFVSRNYK